MNKLLLSTGRDDWETPEYLFKMLHEDYHFTLDPCASAENAKCRKYYTKEQDGLLQDWTGETVFCNPPYSRKRKDNPGQEAWIRKCAEEARKPGTIVVALLPARTDTKAFHRYIYKKAKKVEFLQGRIKFVGATENAPFPSMVVEF